MYWVMNIIIIVLILYLFLIAPTKWLKIERVINDLGLNKKILQISDVHIKNMRVSMDRIKRVIDEEKPDYIFLTGDYIDRNEDEFNKLELVLIIIKNSGVETYAVFGNHDRYIDVQKILNLLQRYNIKVLMNEFVEKEEYVIVGIDDYCKGMHDTTKSFEFNNELQKKVIVLTHDPNIVDHMDESFDYMVTGHLHGKQINVPYFFHIKHMGNLPKRGIYKGLNSVKGGKLYISKGIGQSRWNVRFLVRSEITVHEL
jgi:predicted MPP superfamily phosphohydrolase